MHTTFGGGGVAQGNARAAEEQSCYQISLVVKVKRAVGKRRIYDMQTRDAAFDIECTFCIYFKSISCRNKKKKTQVVVVMRLVTIHECIYEDSIKIVRARVGVFFVGIRAQTIYFARNASSIPR